MISRELVYEMLTKENDYAQAWGGPEHDAKFSDSDWILFAEKYFNEAKLAIANFTPDRRAVRSRALKAASLLVSLLQYHGLESDLQDTAGVSSDKNYPILHGGLETFKSLEPRLPIRVGEIVLKEHK